jgi:hypothetical protein
MILKHFVFSGKVLIPGTRKVEALRPVRVIAPSLQQASADMVPLLTEKFGKELPHKQSFSAGYAIGYLQPREVAVCEVVAIPAKSNAKQSKLAAKKQAAKAHTSPKQETTTA